MANGSASSKGASRQGSKSSGVTRGSVGSGRSGPKSPMGGQGTSFSSPSRAASRNKSQAKTPASPMRGQGTVKSPPATKPKSVFGQFKDRYKDRPMKMLNNPAPLPGPIGGIVTGASRVAPMLGRIGNQLVSKIGMANNAQRASKVADNARRMKNVTEEVSRLRGPATKSKVSVNMNKVRAADTLARARARNAPVSLVERGLGKLEEGIDKATKLTGFGRGPVARTQLSSALGAVGESGRQAFDRFNANGSGYAKGGKVTSARGRANTKNHKNK